MMRQVSLALSLAGLSFMMTVIWGGPLLRILRHFKIGKLIRVDEPGHHAVKMGTPTMGGIMVIVPVLLLTILLNAVSLIGFTQSGIGRSVVIPMIVMIGYAILGMIDDWEGIRGKRKGEGMRARTKFLFQVILGDRYCHRIEIFAWLARSDRPWYSRRFRPGLVVHSDCCIHHRRLFERRQLHRWIGRPRRSNLRHRIRGICHDCS